MTAYRLPEFAYHPPPELRGERARHPLVIVGGGLAGLTLAADLASRGVRSILLDEDNTVGVRGASSRGICYVQRTLEVMDRIGIWERIAAKGVVWSAGKTLAGDDVLYSFDLKPQSVSKQPPFVNLQQFYLEWYLVDRIVELGLTELRWKNRVIGIEPHDDHATLTVRTPDGDYAIDADWVVAADGVNSTVRQLLHLSEHTERAPDRWCITDVRFAEKRPVERWTWVEAPFNDGRAVWQHLMADDVWRLDFQMAPDADADYVSRPDVACERVAKMLGPGVEFELIWVGPYSYRSMLMERFRHGRVLFIGDAAHATSPFGARGGNSGVHDADNLGWKLALVLGGRASDALLDTYDLERHRAADENVRITSRTGRFLRPQSAMEFLLRKAVLDLSREHAFARTLLDTGRLCVPHHYRGLATCGRGERDGVSLQNVALGGGRHLIDVLRSAGADLVAFVFGSSQSIDVGSVPLTVVQVGEAGDVGDAQGLLAQQTGTPPGGIALIRPDGHLAASLPDTDVNPLRRAVLRCLGANPEG